MDTIRHDPAMRLMVHQLAYLFNVGEFDSNFTAYSNVSQFVNAEMVRLQQQPEGGAA
jgi:hypothetical protein